MGNGSERRIGVRAAIFNKGAGAGSSSVVLCYDGLGTDLRFVRDFFGAEMYVVKDALYSQLRYNREEGRGKKRETRVRE